MNIAKKINTRQLIFLFCAGLLLLLLFKNPFSDRNLISNLEPYPDTIHYITPAISFVKGEGFFIKREGRIKNPSVPFLYSTVLMPGFLLNSDARMFYFTNILLAFLSLYLLFKIADRVFKSPYITGFVLFLYVTNYFIYWFPTLAMAENLLIPLFLLSVLMLIEKVTTKRTLLAGFLVLSFYATKYAMIPLSASLFLLYVLKIFWDNDKGKKKVKPFIYFVLSVSVFSIAFFLFEYITKGVNVVNVILYFLPIKLSPTGIIVADEVSRVEPWFALKFFSRNLPMYLNSITGHPMRFLWDFTPIVPQFAAVLGLLGMTIGLFYRQFRFISLCLLVFLFSQILFISTFYSTDARYIYHAVPLILISFGIFLTILKNMISKKNIRYSNVIFYCFISLLFLFYLYISAARIKYQIALNLRHAETPWYHVSVEEANKYFDSNSKSPDKKLIMISALPPYYVDYFSGNRYLLLPLSNNQEFPNEKEIVWGPDDYSDLIKLYSKYINEGYEVYVSNYGLGNEAYLHADFDKITESFELVKVQEGCFNACNIFKLKQKM